MYEISLEFAKYQRDQLIKCAEKSLKTPPELRGIFEGQIRVWQQICTMACLNHEWEISGAEKNEDTNFEYTERTCKHCGTKDDGSYDYAYLTESMTQGCHNCKHREIDGGDTVPYGMGSVTTPEVSYCIHPDLDDISEEEQEKWLKEHELMVYCPNWEGR